MNWLAYNMGHDIALPHSRGRSCPYLMYPNGETGGERLDQLDPDAFKYSMTARELTLEVRARPVALALPASAAAAEAVEGRRHAGARAPGRGREAHRLRTTGARWCCSTSGPLVRALPRGDAEHAVASRELRGRRLPCSRSTSERATAGRTFGEDGAALPDPARSRHGRRGLERARASGKLRDRARRQGGLHYLGAIDWNSLQVKRARALDAAMRLASILALSFPRLRRRRKSLTVPFITTDEVVHRMLELAQTRRPTWWWTSARATGAS